MVHESPLTRRARGPREFAEFSSALKILVVCRRRCTASLADPNMEPIAALGGRPRKKNARARLYVCHPKHNQAGPIRVRARYRRFYVRSNFVRLLERLHGETGRPDVNSIRIRISPPNGNRRVAGLLFEPLP